MTLWKGRFQKEMSDMMWDFNQSLKFDIRFLPYDILTNKAWAKELAKINLLTGDEYKQLISVLERIEKDFSMEEVSDLGNDEDVHSLIERHLTESLGEVGKKIHTGRSRNDQVATDMQLFLKDASGQLSKILKDLLETAVKLSEDNINTFLPSYTHLQQAQPISFAHYILSLGFLLKEDLSRISDFQKRIDVCPLGSGAVAGSAYPIDRSRLAKELGFSKPTDNSIVSVSSRDNVIEFVFILSTIMMHLSRYSEDLIIWSSKEFGFIELDDTVSTGSSMMPQKKNPDSLELIRGKSARVLGQLQTLFVLLKGLPLTYAKDLQEDKPALFDAVDATFSSVLIFNEVLVTLKINKEHMSASISDAMYATDVADYLVKKGLSFRESHKVVAGLVQYALANKISLKDLKLEDFKKASLLFDKDIVNIFSVQHSINLRNLKGGTGPESIKEQIKILKAII
jgi:argininosuccinate lyase